MSNWRVGDRCQEEKGETIRTGVITEVHTDTHEVPDYGTFLGYNHPSGSQYVMKTETYIKEVSVKWDDGEEVSGLNDYHISPEDSEMERTFRLAVDDAHKRIEEKLAQARKFMYEAVQISEETGIPYRGYAPLSQSYIPDSLHTKFPDLDQEFYSEVAGVWGSEEGWQHSDLC